MIEPVAPEHRLRLAVVGDLDGVHTHAWLRYVVARGHDVHGISYGTPARPPEGVRVRALRPAAGGSGRPLAGARPGLTARLGLRLPIGLQRLLNLVRYRSAGIRRAVEDIGPDLLHGHYLVEHGLYGTAAAFRPYVVSAWGSDVLVEAARSRLSRSIARFVLNRANLATANNRHMAREMVVRLGKERAWVQHIVLGVDRAFLEGAPEPVNRRDGEPPTVISTRSLDTPLYNVDTIVQAFARVHRSTPAARLVVVGEGRLRPGLEALVREAGLGDAVRFTGFLSQDALRDELSRAHVFVSTPDSDGTSVALLQAMGAGCFPIVSDLPSQEELVEGDRGLRVTPRDEVALAEAIGVALDDRELRRDAVERNRAFVEEYGVTETNMARMEAWYYRLAGRAAEAMAPEGPAP